MDSFLEIREIFHWSFVIFLILFLNVLKILNWDSFLISIRKLSTLFLSEIKLNLLKFLSITIKIELSENFIRRIWFLHVETLLKNFSSKIKEILFWHGKQFRTNGRNDWVSSRWVYNEFIMKKNRILIHNVDLDHFGSNFFINVRILAKLF